MLSCRHHRVCPASLTYRPAYTPTRLSSPKLLARAGVIFAAVALLAGLAYRTPTERALALVGLVPSVTEVVVVILVLLLVTPTSVHRS